MPTNSFRTTSHDLLDQLQPASGSPFVCPGSSVAISRSIHLARLNAAWPGCDQCEWRFDSEGLAERTVQETDRIRTHRIDGIRRTEFGIRGQYINDLDRQTAADLTRIFCACLHEQSSQVDPRADERTGVNPMSPNLVTTFPIREGEAPAKRLETLNIESRSGSAGASPSLAPASPALNRATFQSIAPVVVGYDGRSASVDLAIGVVAASREFGLPVIDIGRCTAASILEAARSFRECSGAIIVTGAGSPNAWAGLDVFDRSGDTVPVVWKDVGVQLEHISSDTGAFLKLQLPDTATRMRWARRLTRQSGPHNVVSFEDRYRDWLLRWYPKQSNLRILVRTDDDLIQQRLAWISEVTGLEIICRSLHDSSVPPHVSMTVTVPEDDRQFQIINAANQRVTADRLALMLNRAMHSQSAHVTAHADAASGRFWISDAARIGSPGSAESIRDALVTLGLVSRLIESKRLNSEM